MMYQSLRKPSLSLVPDAGCSRTSLVLKAKEKWTDLKKMNTCVHLKSYPLSIHPFREGNGRVARMLAALMALQAGLPPLDFSGIVREKKKEYITAIQEGMSQNYRPMEKIFASVIQITLRAR